MSVRRGENPGSIYEIFEEVATHIFDDNYINMTPQQFLNDIILPVQIIIETLKTQQKEKEILQRRGSFLEPDEEEDKIYDQLSEKQYREILRGQIQ